MVEINLERDWYLIHKNKQWIIARKTPCKIKVKGESRNSFKLYKSSSFNNPEIALKYYLEHIRLDDNDIASWKELVKLIKEGQELIKKWMVEIYG